MSITQLTLPTCSEPAVAAFVPILQERVFVRHQRPRSGSAVNRVHCVSLGTNDVPDRSRAGGIAISLPSTRICRMSCCGGPFSDGVGSLT